MSRPQAPIATNKQIQVQSDDDLLHEMHVTLKQMQAARLRGTG